MCELPSARGITLCHFMLAAWNIYSLLLNSTDKITKQSLVKSDIVSREIYGTYPVYQVWETISGHWSGQVFSRRPLKSDHKSVSMTDMNQSYLHWLKFWQFQVLDRGLVKFQLPSFFLKVSNNLYHKILQDLGLHISVDGLTG